MEQRNYVRRTPYEEYCDMPEDVRCELINGRIVMMASPSLAHESICSNLHGLLWNYLRGKRCRVYQSVGVQFSEDEPINNALRPDIAVVCDPNKFKKQGIVGAPDLIVEVISPSSSSHDLVWKFNSYQDEGVKEYWAIDPERSLVFQFILENGVYTTKMHSFTDKIPVAALDGCVIDVAEVAQEPTVESQLEPASEPVQTV
ncbi:hypothetical protein FACS1894184_04210 [Clostridia bacterium]|nr:hypothetical protein FACS1894184_04210 [Clostridia bacterium]